MKNIKALKDKHKEELENQKIELIDAIIKILREVKRFFL